MVNKMDRAELEKNLEGFKQACIAQGYIDANKDALILEESYPGMKPTSFIVNVVARDEWLTGKHHRAALKELDELLYKTADAQTLENILTLRFLNLGNVTFALDSLECSILGRTTV
jgi:hypothetical protein